jgi:hypothetical protein
MNILVSKDEEQSIYTTAMRFTMADGDMLLAATTEEIDKVGAWLGKNGLTGVYTDIEEDDFIECNDFMFTSSDIDINSDNHLTFIRLLK